MGLFNFNNSRYEDDLAVAPGAKDGKIYKIVQLASISVILIAIILGILEAFQLLKIDSTVNGIIFSIAVIGLGGMSALPWVRVYESIDDKRFKITALAFLGVIGVCTILWVICVWQVIGIYKNLKNDLGDEALKGLINSLNFIRVSVIISLQFVIGSSITMNIIKYRKTLLPYQVMAGISNLYMDFYFTLLLTAITITNDGFGVSPTATFLINHWQWLTALFAVAIALMALPSVVFRRTDRKRLLSAKREQIKELAGGDNKFDSSVEEKLNKIRTLLDNGLISQEEYEAKRAEILKNL